MVKQSHSSRPVTTRNKRETVDKTFWDTDFFEDEGIIALEMEFQDAAPAYYMRIAFMILRNGGPIQRAIIVHRLKKAISLDAEGIERFIDSCKTHRLLTEENGFISSVRAEREIENLSDQREVWRDEKKLQRERAKAARLKALEALNVHPDISPEVRTEVPPESIREGKGSVLDDLNKDLKKSTRKRKPIDQELKQYRKFLRMNPQSMKKLVAEFGRDAVIKQMDDADHWIATDASSNAAKYRGPRHDHYLFFKGWLKRNAGLKTGSMTGISGRVEPKLVHPPEYIPPKPEPPADPAKVQEFRNKVAEIAGMKSIPPIRTKAQA